MMECYGEIRFHNITLYYYINTYPAFCQTPPVDKQKALHMLGLFLVLFERCLVALFPMVEPMGDARHCCGRKAGFFRDVAIGEAFIKKLDSLPAPGHFFEFFKRTQVAQEREHFFAVCDTDERAGKLFEFWCFPLLHKRK